MSRYDKLMARLGEGDIVLIDGATGTEIEKRGVPQLDNAWNGGGALSHPDIVRGVHAEYLELGADVVISNTFATGRNALRDAGVEADFEAYNRRGVELALEARDASGNSDALVAGGISYWSWTGNAPSLPELDEATTEQAAIMAAAGADLLMLEMMIDIERMLVSLAAAQRTGLPVWVGFTCSQESGEPVADDAVPRLRGGEPLVDAAAAIAERDVSVVTIMHTGVERIDDCLDTLRDSWAGYAGVYAHSGDYIDGKWIREGIISPEEYSNYAAGWIDRGARLIGGCCGVGPEHVRRLAGIGRRHTT